MKVILYSRFGDYPKEIETLIKNYGLEIVDPGSRSGMTSADAIITYGGDGTLLGAERDWPGIPKLPLKNSDHCHLCYDIPNEKLLQLLIENKLKTVEYFKLEAIVGDKKIIALNDIVIAHKFPNNAIRFVVDSSSEFVGDGLVISTPFGSTGYFYSVTKTTFSSGIGIAFNNIHNADIREKTVDENEEIKIILTRGPAVIVADNDPKLIDLKEDNKIIIKKASQSAYLLSP